MKEVYLRRLGLSGYETKVFLSLLRLGRSKARKIARFSKVPYGRIYDVLYSLEQKGIILVTPSEPKVFEAINPSKALDILLKIQQEKIKNLSKEKNVILREFQKVKAVALPEKKKDKVSVYYGSDAAIKLGRIGIEKTKKEMLINTTRLEDLPAQNMIAGKLLEKVSVKIMIPEITKANRENIKRIKSLGGEVRIGGIENMKIGIADREGTLITVANPKNLKGSITIVIEGKNFAKSIKDFFNVYWNKAKKV
ncbi:MAG: TrmB family transcriptional regulator [Candidatus Aenigmatarchaeota archaeon]